MAEPPQEIEFEHRRVKTEGVSVRLPANGAVSVQATRLFKRARLSRALFVLGGAVTIAWATQRAGIALPQAVCLFFGALPVLWVGGWMVGAFFQARRTASQLASEMGSSKWRAELEAATVLEKVKLSVQDGGLRVVRPEGEKTWAWTQVSMNRIGPSLMLGFSEQFGRHSAASDQLTVPEIAFASPALFDDFCLLIQRRLWEAERAAFTNRRA